MKITIELGQQPDGRWSACSPDLPDISELGADRVEAARRFQTRALRAIADRVSKGEIEPDAASVSFDLAKPYKLGILLVHGIGSQLAREVLVGWGDSLVKAINLATRDEVSASVRHAEHASTRVASAEAIVEVTTKESEETWLMSEGWWADAFPVPTYGELVRWSVSALPWSIALHVAQEYWEAGERPAASVVGLGVRTTLKLFAALLLAPLFIILLAISLLLGWLPVPQIRSWILAAQGALSNTIGDSLVFVESPMRAALIRTRILDAIERLADCCQRTIVVAHSQGAAIVVDALGGMVAPGVEEAIARPFTSSTGRRPSPDTLLTFGAGVNPLAMLKALSSGTVRRTSGSPVWVAISALAVAALVIRTVYLAVKTGSTTGWQLLEVNVALALAIAGLSTITWIVKRPGVQHWLEAQFTHRPRARKFQGVLVALSVLVVFAVVLGLPYYYFGGEQLPIFSVSLFWLSLVLLLASFIVILSGDMKRSVALVQMPPGLHRWVDIHASHDPVPNGRVIASRDGAPESVTIWNLGSVFADHTSYWNNLDGFVLRVVRLCAETAASPWTGHLPVVDEFVDMRAAWRVMWLRLARWSAAVTLATFSLPLWVEFGGTPLPWSLPAWLPAIAQVAIRYLILAGAILASIWLAARILRFIWEPWVRFEQKKVLTHQPLGDHEWYPLVGMMIVLIALVLARIWVAGVGLAAVPDLLRDPSPLEDAAAMVIGGAGGLAVLLMWLRPAPRREETPKPGSTSTSP
jgi:predicted RNase H-like HicB family nuclease